MSPILKYLTHVSRSAILCLLLCASWGCVKPVPDCELVLRPRLMPLAGSPKENPTYMARVYAFYVEGRDAKDPVALRWAPGSWEDAEAGLVRNSVTGEVLSHGLMAEQGESDISLVVTRSPVLLMVVDPVDRYYAWRVFSYDVPMPKVMIDLYFQLWKPTPYEDLEWTFDKEQSGN